MMVQIIKSTLNPNGQWVHVVAANVAAKKAKIVCRKLNRQRTAIGEYYNAAPTGVKLIT